MKATDARFEIRPGRPGTGLGLFTRERFSGGEFIIEYTGVRIPTKEADFHRGRYLFEVDEDWTIDGEPSSGLARYINHSCEPNAEAKSEKGHLNFYAVSDISAGEEITIDYGQEYFDEFIRPLGCKCGARVHRT